jgi:hypothetical protein
MLATNMGINWVDPFTRYSRLPEKDITCEPANGHTGKQNKHCSSIPTFSFQMVREERRAYIYSEKRNI